MCVCVCGGGEHHVIEEGLHGPLEGDLLHRALNVVCCLSFFPAIWQGRGGPRGWAYKEAVPRGLAWRVFPQPRQTGSLGGGGVGGGLWGR